MRRHTRGQLLHEGFDRGDPGRVEDDCRGLGNPCIDARSMMSNTIRLEIATPEAMVYSDDVEMVTLPGVDGELSILPQHTRLMTQLVPGEMIVRKEGHDNFMAVGEGLVEVTNTSISIATNMAIAA